MEFLLQEEVSISCLEEETKLITERVGQERLTRLSSVTGSPFPLINRGKMIDKMEKKHSQKIPSCWKAEKILTEPLPEVRKRKQWSREKVSIPAGSVKLVKVNVEGDRRGNRVGHC